MKNEEGKIWFGLGLDNSQLQSDAQKAISSLRGIGNTAEAEGSRIDSAFRKAATGIGVSLAGVSVAGFVQKMFQVRSEFQDTESSMRVFLGSADKAAKFMKELQDYAWYNMFEFSDLTKESAKLLAFGSDVDSVIPTLDKLSNIAAGTKQPLSEFVDLYNKAKNVGKIDAIGLQSWASKGVVITKELKEMGVEVDNSSVKFKHLEMVLDKLTGTGGMFSGLMKEQMNNLSASFGQLQDDITIMFNEIGEKSEGAMKGAIDAADYLIKNYEKVGKTILEIAAAYGVYRAALFAVIALDKQRIAFNAIVQEQMLIERALRKGATDEMIREAAVTKSLTIAKNNLVTSLKSVAKAYLANPYVLAAAAIAAVAYATYKLITYQTDAEKAQKRLNESFNEFEKVTKNESLALDYLFERLEKTKKGTEEYKFVKDKILSQYGQYLKGLGSEIESLNDVKGAYEAISKAALQAAKDRAMAAGIENEQNIYTEVYSENFDKIKKYLNENFSEIESDLFIEAIKKYSDTGKTSNELSGYLSKIKDIENKKFFGTPYILQSEIQKIRDAKVLYDKNVKELEKKFGGPTEVINESAKATITTFDEQLEAAEKRVEAVNKELKNLRKGIIPKESKNDTHFDFAKEIEDKAKELKEAKDKVSFLLTGKAASDAGKDENKLQKKLDAEKRLFELREEAALEFERFQLDMEQRELDLLDDSYDKKYKQLLLNQKKEELAIKEFENKKIQEQQKIEEEEWKKGGSAGVFKPTTTTVSQLPESVQNQIGQMRKASSAKFYYDNKKLLEDLSKQYQTYSEKRLEIEKEFNDELAYLEKNNTDGKYDRNIEELKKKLKEALKAIDNEEINYLNKNSDLLINIFERSASMGKQRLKELMKETKNLINYINKEQGATLPFGFTEGDIELIRNSSDEIKILYEQLNNMQADFDNNDKSPFSGIISGLKDIKKSSEFAKKALKETNAEAKKTNQDQADFLQKNGIAKIEAGLGKTIDGLSKFSQVIGDLGSATNNKSLQTLAKSLENVVNIANTAKQGYEIGGVHGAIVGAAIGIFTSLAKAEGEWHDRALERQEGILDFQREYNKLLLERNYLEKDYNSIFGTLAIDRQAAAYKTAQKAMLQYYNALGINEKRNSTHDRGGITISSSTRDRDAPVGQSIGQIQNQIQELQKNEKNNERTLLQSAKVLVREHKWYQSKSKDKYAELFDIAPQLWGGKLGGEFDVEAAQLFLNTNTQINGELRDQIQNVIDLKEEYDDAMTVVNEQLKNWLGNMATSMADSIWDSVVNGGKDAWGQWQKIGADAIAAIGKQMIAELIIDKYLNSFSDDLEKAYLSKNPGQEIANVTSEIIAGFPAIFDSATAAAQNFVSSMEAQGVDFSAGQDNTRTASAKGFASMSQDSANELNGRFTTIQSHTFQINENVKFLVVSNTEANAIRLDIKNGMTMLIANSERALAHLAGIESNTQFCSRLDGMDSDLRAVKNSIDDINLKGIRLRQ